MKPASHIHLMTQVAELVILAFNLQINRKLALAPQHANAAIIKALQRTMIKFIIMVENDHLWDSIPGHKSSPRMTEGHGLIIGIKRTYKGTETGISVTHFTVR